MSLLQQVHPNSLSNKNNREEIKESCFIMLILLLIITGKLAAHLMLQIALKPLLFSLRLRLSN